MSKRLLLFSLILFLMSLLYLFFFSCGQDYSSVDCPGTTKCSKCSYKFCCNPDKCWYQCSDGYVIDIDINNVGLSESIVRKRCGCKD